MDRTILRAWWLLAAVLALTAAWQPGAARAAEDDAALRDKAMALNRITGDDPIKGKVRELLKDTAGAKKLLAIAGTMAKEKDQPFNYNAAFILASVARELKDLPSSETFYKLCADLALKLQSGQKLAQAYLGLIVLYYNHKKFAEAEKICREFLETEGDENFTRQKFSVIRQMILVLAKQDKFDEANKMVDRLLKAQPDNWLTLELRALVEREAGKYDDAAKTYEDMLARIAKESNLEDNVKAELAKEVRYTLSGVYVDAKKVDKAAEHLQALLKEEPDNPTYNNDLGYIWADHDKNLEESEKLIRKALDEDRKRRKKVPDLRPEDDKDNGAFVDSLGWVLFKQKKYPEAKKYLLEAVKDAEAQHLEIYDHLADVHMALGEKTEAVAAWKKGLELASENKREQQRKVEVEKKLKAAQQGDKK